MASATAVLSPHADVILPRMKLPLPDFTVPLPPFEVPEGQQRLIQFREALREAMSEEMRRDKRIFLLGEEVAQYNGAYKISQGMLDEFGPKRIIDSPISENGFAGLAVGAAMYGLKPIIEFMSWSFSLVAADQILNNVPKMLYMSGGQWGCPVVFRGNDGAGGQLGSTHSWCVEGLYSNVPGVKIVIPSNPYDAKGLLIAAIECDDPVIFLEPKRQYHAEKAELDESVEPGPLWQSRVVRRGQDVTVLAYGPTVKVALKAAEAAAGEGRSLEVIDLRTLSPLDMGPVLESVRRTGRAVVVHEAHVNLGLGAELAARITESCFYCLEAPVLRVGGFDTPYPPARIEEDFLPDLDRLLDAVDRTFDF